MDVFLRSIVLRIIFRVKYILFCVFFLFKAQALIDISLAHTYYITPTDIEGQLNHYTNVGLDFKKYVAINSWFYGVDIASLFALDKSSSTHITATDLFISYKKLEILKDYSFSITLGAQKRVRNGKRKKEVYSDQVSKESWSFMDEVWHLGLWQRRKNWDYFRPEQAGLIGSFLTIEKDSWLLTLFLSGLFIPEQGPTVDIKKGTISSGSRWVMPPQSEFIIFNQRLNALYWLREPYLKNVILNDSIAARFRFGSQDTQWFSLAYAYKPVNQIYFKIDGGFSIDQEAVSSVIHYYSFKHSLISMDFGLKTGFLKTILSVTQEVPVQPTLQEDWIVPVLPKALFLSSYFHIDLSPYYLFVEHLELNFLYTHFSKDTFSGKEDQLTMDLNVNRFKLHSGLSVSAESKEFKWRDQRFSFNFSYWYSIPDGGGWFSTALNWHFSPHFQLEASVDIVGAEDTEVDSFFNTYKQNDRVEMKLIYSID